MSENDLGREYIATREKVTIHGGTFEAACLPVCTLRFVNIFRPTMTRVALAFVHLSWEDVGEGRSVHGLLLNVVIKSRDFYMNIE